jgi:hypothetical protein
LLDQPVDIIVAEAGSDYSRASFAAAGDQCVGFNRDRDPVLRIKATSRELGSNLADRVSITSSVSTALPSRALLFTPCRQI